jgi:leucyl-tRNA synthetase
VLDFLQLFDSFYCDTDNRAKPIEELVHTFSESGNEGVKAACDEDTPQFTAEQWHAFLSKKKKTSYKNTD